MDKQEEWDFSLGDIFTFALSNFGAISLAALLFNTDWPRWIKIILAVIGFVVWGYSFTYQLECSKLWKKNL